MIDVEYIKVKINNTSIARKILSIESLPKGYKPTYNLSGNLCYIDKNFSIQHISPKTHSSITIPTIEVCLKSNSAIDVIDNFKLTEDVMLACFLNNLAPNKFVEKNLVDCIDYVKKEIYKVDMRPKNVIVSTEVFDNLFAKEYLLKYANYENISMRFIEYDNLKIYPLQIKNKNMVICFAEDYCVGRFIIDSNPYLSNDIVYENIGMYIHHFEGISYGAIEEKDYNRIVANTGGYCKKCNMYDEYAPLDQNGKCLCYICFKPF